MDNVKVERDAAEEPQAVVLRLTPEQAETLQVAWLTAQTMLVGFTNHMKGDTEGEAEAARLVRNSLAVMLADPRPVARVHALLKEVHMQLRHHDEPGAHGEDDLEEPEQNWRCN